MQNVRSGPLIWFLTLVCVGGCVGSEGSGPPVARHSVTRAPVELEPAARRRRPSPQPAATKPPIPQDMSSMMPAPAPASPGVDARILVISADGAEAVLPAIQQTLDSLGTPYTVWVARERPGMLTASALSGASGGRYQGVILTTGSLPYSPDGANWSSALDASEWTALATYEATFGVRQVTWYTFPTPDLGFDAATAVDTSATPVIGSLTPAGQAALPGLAAGMRLPIRNAYTYLAAHVADGTNTPLLVDDAGHALALVHATPDHRENLALTFDGNPNLVHSIALGVSVVDWLTRGVHLGERHTYVGPQVDDIFYENDLYPEGGYRITGGDYDRARAWQADHQRSPVFAGLRLSMVFNGEGATGIYDPDTLTPAARRAQGDFSWVNHTYTHTELDGVAYDVARDEFSNNLDVGASLGLTRFSRANLVTPGITGLTTADAMRAASDVGVRFVVTDTSVPGGAAPSPNAGIYNALVPAILEIPRRPTNLFYNVSTPTQWASEYNAFYRSYWGRDLTAAEIIDHESDTLLAYLLRGENAPWMFHQTNLRVYDGTHSLLTDLLDAALTKYAALLAVPVVSPAMDALGGRVADRMRYDACGATATVVPHASVTLHTTGECSVPITGVAYGAATENYGGQLISYVAMRAGDTVVIPLP